jgi:hypothetical protein
VLFYRYTNYVCVSHTVRANHGVEYDVPPIMRTSLICVTKAFLLMRNGYDRHIFMALHSNIAY